MYIVLYHIHVRKMPPPRQGTSNVSSSVFKKGPTLKQVTRWAVVLYKRNGNWRRRKLQKTWCFLRINAMNQHSSWLNPMLKHLKHDWIGGWRCSEESPRCSQCVAADMFILHILSHRLSRRSGSLKWIDLSVCFGTQNVWNEFWTGLGHEKHAWMLDPAFGAKFPTYVQQRGSRCNVNKQSTRKHNKLLAVVLPVPSSLRISKRLVPLEVVGLH